MAPRTHAILSASSAHRWLNCSPSARLEQDFADRETEAAAEGTAAHALAEHKLRKALKLQTKKPISTYDSDEMDGHTDGYVQYVLETLAEAKKRCPDAILLIEQRLDFSCWVPDGFGTGDALIVADDDRGLVSPETEHRFAGAVLEQPLVERHVPPGIGAGNVVEVHGIAGRPGLALSVTAAP